MSPRNRIQAFLTAMLAGLAIAGMAGAQAPAPERLAKLEAELRDEARVRVLGRFGDLEVAAPRAGKEGITYDTVLRVQEVGDAVPDTVPWADVREIKVRRWSIGRGAAEGAIVGGFLGLVTGLSMTRECNTSEWDFFCGMGAGGVAELTLTAAGMGLVVGAILGAPFHHWSRVYDAPR